ncbi:MAG: ThuA domain-containing protein [Dehalococcoidia bacterium]|nr:ThuA domain-containing protein [Dehalococcoidia bacterium]
MDATACALTSRGAKQGSGAMAGDVVRAHVITGGYPVGSHAGHDHDYVRVQALSALQQDERVHASVSNDFTDIEKWLPGCDFLFTYVAGPYAEGDENEALRGWLEDGGRWLGIHGTAGGRTKRVGEARRKQMVRTPYHETLGAFFLNHEPVRRFEVQVTRGHPLTQGLPEAFLTQDEPYQVEVLDPAHTQVLLTNRLGPDASPPGFGFVYDRDTSLHADAETRTLGYVRQVGRGEVAYFALGHTHTPSTNVQPFVHESVDPEGRTPLRFRGSWEVDAFRQLFQNGIQWGIGAEDSAPA